MLKKVLSLGAALVAGFVSACEDGPATVAGGWRSPATWSTLVYASSKGPVLVEVIGRPFSADQVPWRDVVAQAMTHQVVGRMVAFTARRDEAAFPQYRVVVAFNPPDNADAADLCKGTVPVAAQTGERITVLAAFCENDKALATVRGWVAKVSGPEDKRFRLLMGQVVRDLFGAPQ